MPYERTHLNKSTANEAAVAAEPAAPSALNCRLLHPRLQLQPPLADLNAQRQRASKSGSGALRAELQKVLIGQTANDDVLAP
jgi:hypothetical protein